MSMEMLRKKEQGYEVRNINLHVLMQHQPPKNDSRTK